MTGTPQPIATRNFTAAGPDHWLTAVLRPAGTLAGAAMDRFVDSLTALAGGASLVVVDLTAASIPEPDAFAEALRLPGGLLSEPDRCLLLVGADQALLSALDRCGGQIATLDTPPEF
jgi:hypothetical protein